MPPRVRIAVIRWLLLLQLLLLCVCKAEQEEHDARLSAFRQAAVKRVGDKGKKCHYFPAHAHDDFYSGKWQTLPGNANNSILFYSPCMSAYNLGNSLGNYFNEYACAKSTGVDLVIGNLVWDFPHMPFEYKGGLKSSSIAIAAITKAGGKVGGKQQQQQQQQHMYTNDPLDQHHFAFFHALPLEIKGHVALSPPPPSLRMNENEKKQARHQHVMDAVKNVCKCEKYCWSDGSSPWTSQWQGISELVTHALMVHVQSPEAKASQGTLLKESDLVTPGSRGAYLPLIPDMAIQYRCGDTVPSTVYGFLPFAALVKLAPVGVRFIYVLTDTPSRASVLDGHKKFSDLCAPIMKALFDHLQAAFPNATVVVKSGGDPFIDYARLAWAKVTVCSASTFCLWPALASNGSAHFPVTSLVASYDPNVPNRKLPHFGDHFHWIHKPLIVTSFEPNTKLDVVLKALLL